MIKLVIFDVDGTMADTERHGHLPACNDTMKEIGLDVVWSWDDYKEMINTIPGTENRFRYQLEKNNYEKADIEKMVERFSLIKPDIYINHYLPGIQLRTGIKNFINELIKMDIDLAIISSSYESQIQALLENQLPEEKEYFKIILGKESGNKINSEGYLHKLCLSKMGCLPEEALMIEDSEEGLIAAQCAGIPTVIIYNDYTAEGCFKGAVVVAKNINCLHMDY